MDDIIATAIDSNDLAEIMMGYIHTLVKHDPDEDRQPILGHLHNRMLSANGNLDVAAGIAEYAYHYTWHMSDSDKSEWKSELEAIGGAYAQIVRNALRRGQLEMAENLTFRGSEEIFYREGREKDAILRLAAEVNSAIIDRRATGHFGTKPKPSVGLAELAAKVRSEQSRTDPQPLLPR